MSSLAKAVIPHIIDQHAEEAAFLWLLREDAVNAPHYDLDDLCQLDARVDAHLDGLRIAGDYAWQVCRENLQIKEPGEVFAAAILALEGRSVERINQVYAIVAEQPDTMNGLISAFGWVDAQNLQGKVNGLLVSANPFWRQVGIAACVTHRVDPGKFLVQALADDNIALKVRALQAVGELGRIDLKATLTAHLQHENREVCFWAAWSSVLVGDRGSALNHLRLAIMQNSACCLAAMQVALPVLDSAQVKAVLKVLADNVETRRMAIIGAGLSCDPVYIPWLLQQMQVATFAKVAGEAFSQLCGVDLAYQDMEMDAPEEADAGPTENPEDESVALDADEDLPYPDPIKVQQWWQHNQQHFKPELRYLYGKPVSVAQSLWVLQQGTQRLRYAAAIQLALARPAQALFAVHELGRRQQQQLKSWVV